MNERVKFKEGQQRALIAYAMQKRDCNLVGLNKYLKISYFTLKKYYQEKFLLPKNLYFNICKISDISPSSFDIAYLPENWGASKAGKIGIAVVMKKYKDEIIGWRKKALLNSALNNTKRIQIPDLDENLSEFVGICLGDGTLTPYFVRISGDSRYDVPYFEHISRIIYLLFELKTKIEYDKKYNVIYITARSKNLCTFLHEKYKIPFGDKILNKAKIPEEIFVKNSFAISCLRGLIDTDGSISRRGRNGSQFCLHFCSHNPHLLKQVVEIGKRIGVFTYFSDKGAGTNNWGNIVKYFQIVGSSSLKHIIRFDQKFKTGRSMYVKEVEGHLKKDLYRNLELPFKMGLSFSG